MAYTLQMLTPVPGTHINNAIDIQIKTKILLQSIFSTCTKILPSFSLLTPASNIELGIRAYTPLIISELLSIVSLFQK